MRKPIVSFESSYSPAPPIVKADRKKRFDEKHPRKFPVTKEDERVLKNLYLSKREEWEVDSLTEFLTMMLRFGLRKPPHLLYEVDYKDTGIYKTVKPNRIEKELLSGINGLSIEWGISERQAIHRIVMNVLTYIQQGGEINHEKLQQIKPAARKNKRLKKLFKYSLSAYIT